MRDISAKEYYQIKRVSNSLLSCYQNPRLLKLKMDNPDMEDDDKRHFRIGSALDCLLTGGDFDKEFVVADVTRPYGFMSKFVESLPKGLSIQSEPQDYVEAYNKAGYKMALDRVINNFWSNEEAVRYYKFLVAVEGNQRVLSKDEAEAVFKANELIKANEFLAPYFEPSGNKELLFQIVMLWEYEGVECKGMMDSVLIDHEAKTIQPIDLKTTGKSVYEFPRGSYLDFGYYRQAAFYLEGIKRSDRFKDLLDKGYTILPFLFIVVEVKNNSQHPAVGYRVSDPNLGLQGFVDQHGRRYVGVNELIEALKWHWEQNRWDLPYELYKQGGIVNI